MQNLYLNKYRISSSRCPGWDYQREAAYFITLCTKNRENYFGEILKQKMQLSPTGVIADILWYEIKHHSKNIELDAFVVMPNHIHGIIILTKNDDNDHQETSHAVETTHALSLLPGEQKNDLPVKTRFQNQGKNSLSSIVGSYKSAVSKHAHRLGYQFEWQERFHDHIIRNTASLAEIRNYIQNNPVNWEKDKFFTR